MKIWLDDVREPHRFGRPGWTWVKDYDEFIRLLAEHEHSITQVSFDHDLSEGHYADFQAGTWAHDDKTGYHAMLKLLESSAPLDAVHIHTYNPVGRQRMMDAAREFTCPVYVRYPSGETVPLRVALFIGV